MLSMGHGTGLSLPNSIRPYVNKPNKGEKNRAQSSDLSDEDVTEKKVASSLRASNQTAESPMCISATHAEDLPAEMPLEQWLQRVQDAREKLAQTHGEGRHELKWQKQWDPPRPDMGELYPVRVAQLALALFSDFRYNIQVLRRVVDIATMQELDDELERLRAIFTVLTGCPQFDYERFSVPELRIYFHNGTFHDHANLCSNEAIEARILSLRKPPRPITPRAPRPSLSPAKDTSLTHDCHAAPSTSSRRRARPASFGASGKSARSYHRGTLSSLTGGVLHGLGGWAWDKACNFILPHRYYDSPDDNDWPLEGWIADTADSTAAMSTEMGGAAPPKSEDGWSTSDGEDEEGWSSDAEGEEGGASPLAEALNRVLAPRVCAVKGRVRRHVGRVRRLLDDARGVVGEAKGVTLGTGYAAYVAVRDAAKGLAKTWARYVDDGTLAA